jgi:hypothetical protein
MRNAFFSAALCSFIFSTYLHAQEVIVARETKPEAPKQAVPSSEQSPSESLAQEPAKPKSRQEKSGSALPTLEQMRMAGARAAEGLENRPLPQSTREIAPAPVPTVAETPRPVKRESPVEQRRTSPLFKPRSNKLEGIGPIRPTMIESGREEPSATPSPKAQTRSEQTPAP